MDDIFLLTEVNRQFKIEIAFKNPLSGPKAGRSGTGYRDTTLTKESSIAVNSREAEKGKERGSRNNDRSGTYEKFRY